MKSNSKQNNEGSDEINKNNNNKSFHTIERYSYFGLTIGFSIFALSYLGSLLDVKFKSKFVFTLIGFVWGLAGSIIFMIFTIKKINRK